MRLSVCLLRETKYLVTPPKSLRGYLEPIEVDANTKRDAIQQAVTDMQQHLPKGQVIDPFTLDIEELQQTDTTKRQLTAAEIHANYINRHGYRQFDQVENILLDVFDKETDEYIKYINSARTTAEKKAKHIIIQTTGITDTDWINYIIDISNDTWDDMINDKK